MDNVNVRPVDGTDVAHARVQHRRDGPVDSSDGDSVTRLHFVNQVVVTVKQHCLRRLRRWHVVRRLLQLYQLLVAELRSVVHQSEAVVRVAVGAQCRLSNATAVNLNFSGAATHNALKESLPHLWNDVRRADHHATQSNQLVDICKTKLHSYFN